MGALGGALDTGRPYRATIRARGHIEQLRSGSLRVRVHAGRDAVTGKDLYLREVVAFTGDRDRTAAAAEATRTRLLAQLDAGQHPRSDITISELVALHLDKSEQQPDGIEPKSLATLRGYLRKHIDPLIGKRRINAAISIDALDSFYAELFRCREHCSGGVVIAHWTKRTHVCDRRCRRHECRPLSAWTVRKIHFLLNSAFKRAVRREWALSNPMVRAEIPAAPPPRPQPPTANEAAAIVNAAWSRTYYGPMVWVGMTTGARLGELCALRWCDIGVRHADTAENPSHDCAAQSCEWTLDISRSVGQDGRKIWISDTKTHQHRRVALDGTTVSVLISLRHAQEKDARQSGIPTDPEHFLFQDPKGPDMCLRPGAVSTHYRRFTKKMGLRTSFHKLRHYSATELIAAGVDVRTVAGRLGHSGGGTTTLKIYAAWVAEADQRAAHTLSARMPTPPTTSSDVPPAQHKFAILAGTLRQCIEDGEFAIGDPLPPMTALAGTHGVSLTVAHAAVQQLRAWGYIDVRRGKRATVQPTERWHERPAAVTTVEPAEHTAAAAHDRAAAPATSGATAALQLPDVTGQAQDHDPAAAAVGPRLLQLTVRTDNRPIRTLMATADPGDAASMTALIGDMTDVVRAEEAIEGLLYLDIAEFGTALPVTSVLLGHATALRRRHLSVIR